MLILPSVRRRQALALLMTFAALMAGLSWLLPFDPQPRLTFVTQHDVDGDKSRYLRHWLCDIAPDGHAILVCASVWDEAAHTNKEWQEYWDTTTGDTIEDRRSEELKQFSSGLCQANPLAWDTETGERYIQLIRSTSKEPQPDFRKLGVDSRRSFQGAFLDGFSENGRYYAHRFFERDPEVAADGGKRDRTVIFDLQNGSRIAELPDFTPHFALSPDGRTALTVTDQNGLVLWDLQTGKPRTQFVGSDNTDFLGFYSADCKYIFATRWQPGEKSESGETLRWWTIDGQHIGTVDEKPKSHWKRAQFSAALVDSDRILVTFDSEGDYVQSSFPSIVGLDFRGRYKFWDVASGKQLGEWRVPDKSIGIRTADMLSSRDGRYLVLDGMRGELTSWWDKWQWAKWIHGCFAKSNRRRYEEYQIVLDAVSREEVARLPGQRAAISRDGRVLATQDMDGLIRIYDLPFRKPWARICGFAALAAMGTCGGIMVIRRFIRRRVVD